MEELSTIDSLCEYLETTKASLFKCAYATVKSDSYHSFTIEQRNGKSRRIDQPINQTKYIHDKIRDLFTENYKAKRCVHGYVKGKSIISNAKPHVGKRLVINIDLNDFFGSIHFGRVQGLLLSHGFDASPEVARVLSTILTCESNLPQGSSASPIISNYICRRLDNEMISLAKNHGAIYTRYADDMTISVSQHAVSPSIIVFDADQKEFLVGYKIQSIIHENGFTINYKKFRAQNNGVKQIVTGLKVNKKLNVERSYIRNLRTMIYKLEKFGSDLCLEEYIDKYRFNGKSSACDFTFEDVVIGRLEYLRQVKGPHDKVYTNYALRFQSVVPTYRPLEREAFLRSQSLHRKLTIVENQIMGDQINIDNKGGNMAGVAVGKGASSSVGDIAQNGSPFQETENETDQLFKELMIYLKTSAHNNIEHHEASQEVLAGVLKKLRDLEEIVSKNLVNESMDMHDIKHMIEQLWEKHVAEEYQPKAKRFLKENKSLILSKIIP